MVKLKSPKQIEAIRESGAILAETLDQLGAMVTAGVSLVDIDAECRRILEGYGARPAFLGYMDYPAAICTSVNEQVIHGIPNTTAISATLPSRFQLDAYGRRWRNCCRSQGNHWSLG